MDHPKLHLVHQPSILDDEYLHHENREIQDLPNFRNEHVMLPIDEGNAQQFGPQIKKPRTHPW